MRSGDVVKGETKSSEAHKITAIEWNPANNGEFAYTDSTGQLGTIIDCYNVDDNILENGIDENGSVTNDVDFGDSKLNQRDCHITSMWLLIFPLIFFLSS